MTQTDQPWLSYEEVEALVADLLETSETLSRRRIGELQEEFEDLYRDAFKKELEALMSQGVAGPTAVLMAKQACDPILEDSRMRLLEFGMAEEEKRRQRDEAIVSWVKTLLA